MKRWLLIAAVFLIAGVVVNVAVAWECAVWGSPPVPVKTIPRSLSTEEAGELWERLRPAHSVPKPASLGGKEYQRWGERYAHAYELRDAVPWFDLVEVGERQVGLPAVSLRCIYVRGGVKMVPRHWYVGALGSGPSAGRYAALPLMPTWPGFAVNTIFYSAFLCLLICGPFGLRRIIRVKRGLCPACGYDLRHGEHDACPECGRLPAAR